jgi:hypothetical protein
VRGNYNRPVKTAPPHGIHPRDAMSKADAAADMVVGHLYEMCHNDTLAVADGRYGAGRCGCIWLVVTRSAFPGRVRGSAGQDRDAVSQCYYFNIHSTERCMSFEQCGAEAVPDDEGNARLPRTTGYEVGFRTRRFDRVAFSAAFWLLYLDSELVFVGDEGITEASAATKRLGFELFTRVKLLDRRCLRGDITNMTDEFRGSGDAVPLAPRFTARGDANARLPFGLSATLQAFHVGKRHMTEDRRVNAEPYAVVDLITRFRLPYKLGPGYLSRF